ncbi:hypothetical protein BABINDRAFT_160713 [Babjeviella inositovora NRRL Y-12698]|uniref:Arrestin-like N-terminal domain-containing protein n=1 Tax=Babjeviella inositovora NRRL Y-12698 TaxID=984486 RepID=A0A1E3QUK6_9ASCO|nr:uncharacterized protein BABINDRAFT_160713 [Babjeviella inositovora NRRL Y-12698]ODQ81359.1 hypothetical protein BABINDRAFT_160713 [Babjeviella inositovora NRRL Y-12698]
MGIKIKIKLAKTHYTNEPITGVVIVHNTSDITVDHIDLKLEGVSNCKIRQPVKEVTSDGLIVTKARTVMSEHKLMYQTLVVFPPQNVRCVSSPTTQFTLTPGKHVYPFEFAIPYGTDSYGLYDPNHITYSLPPTLARVSFRQGSDRQGEVEVSYYVKAVVYRKGLLNTNTRKFLAFNFAPVDVTRPVNVGQLTLSRLHTFVGKAPLMVPDKHNEGDYKRLEVPRSALSLAGSMFSKGSIIARRDINQEYPLHTRNIVINMQLRFNGLPGLLSEYADNYDIYVTTKRVPKSFRLANGESSGLGLFFLSNIEIRLTGLTQLTVGTKHAHEGLTHWLIGAYNGSHSFDLADATPSSYNPAIYEVMIPREVYSSLCGLAIKRRYHGVVPSFSVDNITRSYQLGVKAEFRYTAEERTILSLNKNTVEWELKVQVWSGIDAVGPAQVVTTPRTPENIPLTEVPSGSPIGMGIEAFHHRTGSYTAAEPGLTIWDPSYITPKHSREGSEEPPPGYDMSALDQRVY